MNVIFTNRHYLIYIYIYSVGITRLLRNDDLTLHKIIYSYIIIQINMIILKNFSFYVLIISSLIRHIEHFSTLARL